MCYGIRISSPFHLATQIVSIQNLNCPKNACADMIFGMIFHTCKVLFHICKILFHECGIYSTSLSNISHFHKMFSPKVKFRESKVIKCMNIICIKFSFLIAEPWLPSSTWSGDKNHSAHAFLGKLRFLMDTI